MKRTNPDYSTTVVEEKPLETLDYGTQPVLKLKRSRQTLEASKRLAFELSQYSTQQEILQTLVDLEKELPLESLEVTEFVIRTLWERFYETTDVVVRVKVVSLLGSVARFPGVNIHAIAEELIKLLNTDGESRDIGNIICLCFAISKYYYKHHCINLLDKGKQLMRLLRLNLSCLLWPYKLPNQSRGLK